MNALFPSLQPEPDADTAYTHPDVAAACARVLLEGAHAPLIWEPCAGNGAWLPALRGHGRVVASELDPKAGSVQRHEASVWDARRAPLTIAPEVICTNPPFSIAAQLLRGWLAIPSVQRIGLLLLQSWSVPVGQGSERRDDLCWGPVARMARKYELYPRLSFGGPGRTAGKTDMREYAFCMWERRGGIWCHRDSVVLERLVWR